ncbi:hypothetical protein GTZ97_09290 [Aquabacterium fontiphilum]|jgi:hypothetical protein|uniref:hypothetical protein n=1 Tax=Aquabacterium fontiphilum TaxID=450365 RepID=UPI00137692F5|nr:hypothetical protein [Aquabacterium fontiphilum]NBD20861.1 hypothetical protein [Aquabacterium fontiphilum]
MRPLFAITPLLGLLLWFGEPVTDTGASPDTPLLSHHAPLAASSVAEHSVRTAPAGEAARGALSAHTLQTVWRANR